MSERRPTLPALPARLQALFRPSLLPAITLASYLTSFLRERYLIQHALGTQVLDESVAAYGLAAMAGNFYAVVLGLIWLDGRPIPTWARSFPLSGSAGIALIPFMPTLGSCITLASLVAACEYHRQRSAFRNRQAATLLFACVAPGLSIACWSLVGVDTLLKIVGGYCLGYLAQAAGARIQAANASRPRRPASSHHSNLVWPIIFASSVQLNGLLDRLVLPWLGLGWAAAAAFSFNLATAATLIVAGPLASEAVAGRISTQVTPRTLLLGSAFCLGALLIIPFAMPLLVRGGRATGNSLERVQIFAYIYISALPPTGYFIFRARALQSSSLLWKPIAAIASVTLSVHAGIALVGLWLDQPYMVAIGWSVGAYAGAALIASERWLLPQSAKGR